MNWGAIGALGELAGAFAVVASLIYVSYQLKQNTSSVRGERYQSINSELMHLYLDIADSDRIPGLIDRFTRQDASLEDFDPEDRVRVRMLFTAAARLVENIYRQVDEGNLPESALQHMGSVSWFLFPIAGEVWIQMKANFSEDFIEYQENRFENLAAPLET